MNKTQKEDRDRNIKALAEAFPGLTDEQVSKFQDKLYCLSLKVQNNAIRLCNESDYVDQREALRAEYKKICSKFGVEMAAVFEGDPRGCVFKVMLPTGRFNTLGGAEEGWAI